MPLTVLIIPLFPDVNIATERRRETGPARPPRGRGGRRGGHFRSPSPPFRPPHHRDHYDVDHPPPMWWERERMGWHGSPPPVGGMPHHDREGDFERFPPPPHMRGEPYGRPRDDPYERHPLPRDRERFGPPRDFYASPRDGYPLPSPHDRFSYDYPPPRGRRSPPLASYDRGGPPERDRFLSPDGWEKEREKRVVTAAAAAAPAKAEGGGGEGRSVDMEIIVINRQQRYVGCTADFVTKSEPQFVF